MTEQESKNLLLSALSSLDNKLAKAGSDPVEIRIVGGFALILRGVRETGFTQDIDSMTRDFDPQVKQLIAQTGRELGLKLGWLNADMVLDDPEVISMIVGEMNFENFESFDDYRVLHVSVADLPTLLKLKIVAAGDTLLVRDDIEHERHARDLVALLNALEIDSAESLMSIAPLSAEYPELLNLLFSQHERQD
ncbi:MAG: hypothetical protein LBJ48_05465 [Coriobacteriales bacterium]|jgi:hypothetical protein|nr:hypothetical protein [Coriobacteriales bacterium]